MLVWICATLAANALQFAGQRNDPYWTKVQYTRRTVSVYLEYEMIVNDFVAVLARALRLRTIVVLVGLCAWLPLAGCQILGPAALSAGRGAYNEVIARTSSEQTLGLIVRLRYSDPIGLLAVSNVTAGLKFSTQAKGEAGFGSPASYAGALVPFSAGVSYEDSPLISYAPVDAQAFLSEWLVPVTLETLALAIQGGLARTCSCYSWAWSNA